MAIWAVYLLAISDKVAVNICKSLCGKMLLFFLGRYRVGCPVPKMISAWMATWPAPSTRFHTGLFQLKCHLPDCPFNLLCTKRAHLTTHPLSHFIAPNSIYLYTYCPCLVQYCASRV